MSTRRAPLANVPNATNSPYRTTANPAAKRPRALAADLREGTYGQPPPAKKQMLEENDVDARRHAMLRKAGQNTPTTFQRRLEAARDSKTVQKPAERSQKPVTDNLETIRAWQRHYRKAFPSYVFYFESVPDDVREKATTQLLALRAREEKFFSKAVTHVITTRSLPQSSFTTSSEPKTSAPQSVTSPQAHRQAQTINPSVLDRTQAGNNGDVLVKATEMKMKIWAVEKLQRVLHTMFNAETGEEPPLHNTRGSATALAQTKLHHREADLSQLLRNEKVHGPADRDLAVTTKDVAHFRGYYVYVHCMNEKYRPTIIRDYPKPATKEEGKWPQFKLSPQGRCPFVEDPNHVKSLAQNTQRSIQARTQRSASTAPRTRAAAALEAAQQAPSVKPAENNALFENNNMAKRAPSAHEESISDQSISKPLDPPRLIPAKRGQSELVAPLTRTNTTDSMPPLFGSAQASLRQMPRFAGGEPVASGVQPSNVTSAIRSQMISSTAAAPGGRAGTSKELHQLSRKVLEKNSAPNSTASTWMNDMRAAINDDRGPAPRAAKRKAQETLTHIREDSVENHTQRKVAPMRKKKPVEKDPKPGYCENCREKFDDFDTHIASRKHRKFALTRENWADLDALLADLVRPEAESDTH
ncbi:hypothetical protein K490DRAFT_31893 [Saccharata proteae CBS 121410]|uniref:DBF4-type domain-containing protein n=1 Tax=Saccharata proteae CBS 121410 TaxID=1314787 RepID=A0A9P4I3T4_9PEZI|nr:hypothetical protein K490DRAFT_31893 [Saccharata proteae CBS 121410]